MDKNTNGCSPMTKEQKRERIQKIENEISAIKDKKSTIDALRSELQRPDRKLGMKIFTSIGESDEDYHGKQVWIENPVFIKPEIMLKMYEAELWERNEALLSELNLLIS